MDKALGADWNLRCDRKGLDYSEQLNTLYGVSSETTCPTITDSIMLSKLFC